MLWKPENSLKLYLLSWGMRVHFKGVHLLETCQNSLHRVSRWWETYRIRPAISDQHRSGDFVIGRFQTPRYLCSIILLKLRNESSMSARSSSNTPRFKSAKSKKLPGSIEEQKLFLGLATTEEIPALGQNLPVNLVVPLLELRCLKCFFLHVLVTM